MKNFHISQKIVYYKLREIVNVFFGNKDIFKPYKYSSLNESNTHYFRILVSHHGEYF